MSLERAYQVMDEIARIQTIKRPDFFDPNFPHQAKFILDSSKLKAAQCPRRAGKSRGIGLWLLEPVFNEPNVTTLYLAKTRDSARRIMWRDVLKTIDQDLGLNLHPHETDLTLTNLNNGSILQIAGADSGPHEMKKFLGSKLKRVAIDESADFRQDLEMLVYEVLLPAMADHEGEIALIGSTGLLCKGLFYEVTNGLRNGWSVHKWSSLDNPYMREKILRQIGELETANPRVRETPWFRRNYLNEWVQETTSLVYKYQVSRNDIEKAPEEGLIKVLGVDLGFNDDSAFAIAGYSLTDRTLYGIEAYKKSGMIISDVAERIAYYQKIHNPYAIVIDNASKQAVEELKQRFQLPLLAADKAGKSEFIEIMNSEYILGNIKMTPAMAPLVEEYEDLIWDDKSSRREEHPGCANHCADAFLYAWRYCYQYLSKPVIMQKKTDEEKVEEWADEQAEHLYQSKQKAFWER